MDHNIRQGRAEGWFFGGAFASPMHSASGVTFSARKMRKNLLAPWVEFP